MIRILLTFSFLFGAMAHAVELPGHPFVLINSEELKSLRVEVMRSGWKQEIYRASDEVDVVGSGHGIRANADRWLHRKIEIPARGGHYHWFFCEDGNRLEMPKDQRFAPGPYRCPKCGREYSGEKYESAVRRMVHSWLSVAARDLALVSAIEQKPEFGAKAAEILLKYADAYPGPHTDNLTGGMIYQSLDEAMWIIPLAQAYDLIYNQLKPPERDSISNFLRIAAEGIQKCGVHGNWGSWHLSSVGVVGYAIGDTNLITWATEQFKAQIRDQLGDDSLWPESVHTYHFFPLLAFLDFAEAAWHAGDDLYRWEAKPGKSLAAMFTAPLEYAYPNLQLPAINDGWFNAYLPADMYELAWRRLGDPRFAWVLSNGYRSDIVPAGTAPSGPVGAKRNGLFAFLFGEAIPTSVMPPAARSVNFPVLGICILRSTNGAMMTFDYGPFLGHGQRDKMGVTLFANGKLWAADYGTPGYGAAILPWYQSTFSHNTVVVDGKSQNPTKENNCHLWLDDKFLEAGEAKTIEAYTGVTHTRTVVRLGDCFVLRDKLVSDAPHTYDLYLHAEGKLKLDRVGQASRPSKSSLQQDGNESASGFNSWIEDLKAFEPIKHFAGEWSDGKQKLAVAIWSDRAASPFTSQCPAETGSRKIPLLIVRQSGTNAEFVTVLQPLSAQKPMRIERRGEALEFHGALEGVLTLPINQTGPKFQPRH